MVTKPGSGSVYINAIRPSDDRGTPFGGKPVQQVYGNVLLTDSGCIKAVGKITVAKDLVAEATTRCVTPAHLTREAIRPPAGDTIHYRRLSPCGEGRRRT